MDNDTYIYDIFYNVKDLSLDDKKNLLEEALIRSYEWRVDILESFQRQKIEMKFEDIIKKLKSDSHFIFIHRRGYKNSGWGKWRLETGFRTFSAPDHFLWIWCEEEEIPYFVEKYKLKP
jgi:hypothetical protein